MTTQVLLQVIQQARDQAKAILQAAELEQLAPLCAGKLEPLKPLLDEAVKIARGR